MIRVGTDLVVIARIEKARSRFGKRFLQRYLHSDEWNEKTPTESLAGYWAAKEAIAKALGCGIGSKLGFHDILLYKESGGAPAFKLVPKMQSRFPIRQSSLSISHDGGFAIAVVVLVLANPEILPDT